MQGLHFDAPGPAEDAADRVRAEQAIDESLVVEAGAGTGKTTLLIHRILNLLRHARVDQPPRPVRMQEIVAITFTEKAAGELKARLRAALETAVSTSRLRDEPIPPNELALLAQAQEDLDRAVVSTIHSFCAALIRERPVEAGVDPGRTTADAITQTLLFDEAWQRWRERALENRDDTTLAQTLRLDVKADRSGPGDRSASLRDLAETLVNNRDLVDFLPAPIDPQAAWTECRTALDERAVALTECLAHTKSNDKPARVAAGFLEVWKTARTSEPRAACRQLNQSVDIPRASDLGGDCRRWRDSTQLDRLRELLSDLRERLLPDSIAKLTHNLMVELAHRLKDFVLAYDKLKEQRGLLDFQDLLLIARKMLAQSEEVREYFRRRFRFLLIDEFQDTDPLQVEVAQLLCKVGGQPGTARGQSQHRNHKSKISNLFLVGDPKQSIYRFRRADIEVYDQSMRLLGEGQHVRIRQNFRSGSHIISWVNRVFSRLIEPSSDGHFQPEYVSLLPGPHADEFPGRVVLLYPPEPETDCTGRIDQIRYREGCCIALYIKQAVAADWPCSRGGGSLRFEHCAILLPQTTGIEQYEEAFRACGLPYHLVGGKHFFQRIEIKSLINVATSLDNPEDGIALVGALRGPFFGCSDEELLQHALAGGKFHYLRPVAAPAEPLAGIFSLLERLHRDRNRRPVAATLLGFLEATKGLELFLTKPHGAARVANLLKVVDAARAMERTGVLTFRGFARWLRERQNAREEEADSAQAESGDESVTVLTIHKAKGLEFPLTAIADLSAGESRPEDRVIFDRLQGRLHLRCGPLRTAGWREAQAWDLRRVQAERRRLFYVAATRACDYLVLPVFWRKQGTEPTGVHSYLEMIPDLLPPADNVPWDQTVGEMVVYNTRTLPPWPKPEHAPRIKLDEAATDPTVARFLVNRTEWARSRDAVLEAARKAVPVVHASELAGPSLPPRKAVSTEPFGPDFGTLVHRLLELHLTGQIARDKIEQTARCLAADTSLSDASASSAAQLVTGALNSPTIQRLRAAKRVSFEVPFTYIDRGTIVEGRIDALAEEDAGILLVDFKTDAVDPGGEPASAAHYAPQVRAYASAIAAATGRPAREALLFFLRTNRTVPVPPS